MRLEQQEVEALAEALAPKVAGLLAERFERQPEWAKSVSEAAAWAEVPEHTVRDAVASGRLPCVRVGRQIRIRRSDLFGLRGGGETA